MKKLNKICAIALLIVMSLSLVACVNTYPKIKSAFEDAGYKQSETFEGYAKDFKSITNNENKEIAVTAHAFGKLDGLKPLIAIILEFKATDDMIDYYKNNEIVRDAVSAVINDENAKSFYNSLVEAGYANGNCMLIPIGVTGDAITETTTIMKNAK